MGSFIAKDYSEKVSVLASQFVQDNLYINDQNDFLPLTQSRTAFSSGPNLVIQMPLLLA